MVLCFIAGCNNSSNRTASDRSYFRIPKKHARLYYNISRRADLNKHDFINHSHVNYRICDAHFNPSDIVTTRTGGGKRLKSGAVPTRQPYAEVSISRLSTNIV